MLQRPYQFPTGIEGARGAAISPALCLCHTPASTDLVADIWAKPFCPKMGLNKVFWYNLSPVTMGKCLAYLV